MARDEFTAFRRLITNAEEIAKIPRAARTSAEQTDMHALTVGADFIRQMAGSWYPEEREQLVGDGWDERLDALEREVEASKHL